MNIKWNVNVKLNDIGSTVLLEINKFKINGNRVFSKCEYQNSISRHKDRNIYPMDFKMHRDGKGTNPWEHR
ncbi:hypothetical protein VY86_09500 [Photorhabdus thracensis]|uniref:Uncharacterized protein n=1 Tax=Photorhabdus thracensis TaxID=230089 RepID=A0A0F7LLS5_9GAMM|nr:hypothetical protein VY86_09500 [Photorhabdus thracensis]